MGRLTAAQLARAVRQEPGQTVVTEEEKEAPPAVRGLEGVGEAARAELEAGAAAIAAAALRPGSARYADACARAAEARAVADALWRRTGLN